MLDLSEKTLNSDDAALLEALTFGAKGGLDKERQDALRETGTVHIVAASGLHILVLVALVQFLLSLFPISRGLTIGTIALILLFYSIASGLHPGTIRASIMVLASLSAYRFRREPDAISALSLAAIAVLLWRPESVYDPGFHLSFVVVLAFSLFVRGGSKDDPLSRAKRAGKASLVATLASAPLTALLFGQASVVGLGANIVVVLAAAPIIALTMLALLIAPIWHGGAVAFMHVAGTLANGLACLLDNLGPRPWSTLDVPAFSPYWLIAIYGLPLILWRKSLREP